MLKKFEKVTRIACKASVLIEGIPGKGKSGLALIMARALASAPDKVYAVDTENRSLNLFAGISASSGDKFKDFQVVQLESTDGYRPTNYLFLREQAIKAGCEVFIKDSISHAWQYEGGVLSMVSKIAENSPKGDKFAPWRDVNVVKEKNALLELLRHPSCHVITTVRLKEKFALETEDGKTKIKSIGEQQIMQDDIKYEPDLVLHMISPGSARDGNIKHPVAKVLKSRYAIFTEGETYNMTPELLQQLKAYLAEGIDPDQLLAEQKEDYVKGIVAFLEGNPMKKALWQTLKADKGYGNTKLPDVPLSVLKELYTALII